MFKFLAFGVVLLASTVQCGFFGDFMVGLTYSSIKLQLIESGKSAEYADCFTDVLDMTGTENILTNMWMVLDTKAMKQKLYPRFVIADVVCSLGGIAVFTGLLILLLVFCCGYCCCGGVAQPKKIRMMTSRGVATAIV